MRRRMGLLVAAFLLLELVLPGFSAPGAFAAGSASLQENTVYTFTADNFGVAEGGKIKITSQPSLGALTLDGVAVSTDAEIDAAAISGGFLEYTPLVNTSGDDSFHFQLFDGTLLQYGSDTQMSITIIPEAAPSISNISKTGLKNTTFLFSQQDFQNAYTSVKPLAYIVTGAVSPAGSGVLTVSGSVVTPGDQIPASALGNLAFTPYADFTGAASFTWFAGNGSRESTTKNVTMTINGANAAPVIISSTITSTAETAYAFSASDFTSCYSDAEGAPLARIIIDSLPSSSSGTLYYNGSAAAAGLEVTAANINRLSYIPKTTGTSTASFSWRAYDGNAYSNKVSMTLSISMQNHAPVLKATTKTMMINTVLTFSASDFSAGFTDADTSDTLKIIKVEPLSSAAALLKYNGSVVTASTGIPVSSISKLTLTPLTGWSGDLTLSWNGSDGTSYAAQTANMTIRIGSNSPPSVSSFSVSVSRDTARYFKAAEFTDRYSDAEKTPLASIKIRTLPKNGTLRLNSTALSTDSVVDASSLTKLNYVPDSGWKGTDSFTWLASDGTDFTPSSGYATVTLSVGGKNTEPTITSFKIGDSEYTNSKTVTLNVRAKDDEDGTPAQISYCLSGSSWSSWQTYSTTVSVKLSGDDGLKTVKVRVRDSLDLVSDVESDTITLDTQAPTLRSCSINDTGKIITMTFNEAIEKEGSLSVSDFKLSENGDSFSSLSSKDSVSLSGSAIKITLKDAISGDDNKIKLLKNSIKDKAGNVLEKDTTGNIGESALEDMEYSSSKKTLSVTLPATTPSSSHVMTVEVTSDDTDEIFKKLSSYNGSNFQLVLIVPEEDDVTGIVCSVDQTLFADAAKNDIKSVTVSTQLGQVSIPVKSVSSLIKKSSKTGKVDISISVDDDRKITGPGSTGKITTDVYTVAVKIGSSKISSFNDRSGMRVSLPTGLKSSKSESLVAVRVASTGKCVPMPGCKYSSSAKQVTFKAVQTGDYAIIQNEVSFNDTKLASWGAGYINSLSARGVIDGMSPGEFRPNNTVTRAEYIKMLILSLDLLDSSAACSYQDVRSSDWFYPYIATAYKLGIVPSSTKFYPNAAITRQDMAAYSYKAAYASEVTLPATQSAASFTDDGKISAASRASVTAMQRAGILSGFPDGSFGPGRSTTRVQASKVIFMILEFSVE